MVSDFRAVQLIERKKRGLELSENEIRQLISRYMSGEIPDYQMSAFTMAVCWRGMSKAEMSALTMAMADSGEKLDLSSIPGIKVDKHSTGGVGDTTTLVLGPLLASVGVTVAKMSGRGLGHTGGTIDKLESIPGFRTDISSEQFFEQAQRIGIVLAGQSGELAPADKALYALRDVTGTVDSIPLIASSIMSKKLASGADALVLDVKVGEGAFMPTEGLARQLARTMVSIGQRAGRRTVAILSRMDEPLGYAIGNALEVYEAIMTLQGRGPEDLTNLCLTLGSELIGLAEVERDSVKAYRLLQSALLDGRAWLKFKQLVAAQGGDVSVLEHPDRLLEAPVIRVFRASETGYVKAIRAKQAGEIAMRLGAGRREKMDVIDSRVGLMLCRKVGDRVAVGDALVHVHAQSVEDAEHALAQLRECVQIEEQSPLSQEEKRPLVIGRVAADKDSEYDEDLLDAAMQARDNAYVPYSKFSVGAALRLRDGTIVTGVNIENASYGMTNCAERTAVFSALALHHHNSLAIVGIAVVADSPDPVAPCGACRQVLAEFCGDEVPVILANMHGDRQLTTVGALLPGAFRAEQMSSSIEV